MTGILIMAAITLPLAALICAGLLAWGTHDLRRFWWLALITLPFSALVNLLVKGPMIAQLGKSASIPTEANPGQLPVWFILVLLLAAPILEEWAKALPFLIPPVGRFLEEPGSALWAGVALGMGFGLGEVIFQAYNIAVTPDFFGFPWFEFLGFAYERILYSVAQGLLSGILAFGLQRGGIRVVWAYLGAVALHALANTGALLAQLGIVDQTVAGAMLFLGVVVIGGVFEGVRRRI
jgi:uncharacterized membrane protein YhfC